MSSSATTTEKKPSETEGWLSIKEFAGKHDNSWVRELDEDPEAEKYAPNKRSREVKSGHFVRVRPTPMRSPQLVMHSKKLAKELSLGDSAINDEAFAAYFGGDADALDFGDSWATPYALSIMGEPMFRNCPFGNGNGYGDGRAISVGEVLIEEQRWELQLKGGGTTPFCRGADGRAVLRSSLREFLASEAMDALGVGTTRALSLVVSDRERARRAWYSKKEEESEADVPSVDDPRLAHLPMQLRKKLIAQMRGGGNTEPDVASEEQCAITCRVAPSFIRVGHIDLFARRAVASRGSKATVDALRKFMHHAVEREYPAISIEDDSDACIALVAAVGDSLGTMASEWLRVGFCQGNFNADNCLISGRTMDYGPFGFIDQYDPAFAKWVGSGDHFAFAAQPNAAVANFGVFARSLEPLLAEDRKPEFQNAIRSAAATFKDKVDDVYRKKLGFPASLKSERAAALYAQIEPELLRSMDYTIFFRELATIAENYSPDDDDATLLKPLYEKKAFYASDSKADAKLASWLREWLAALGDDLATAPARMRLANPKYILREWMLVEAYEAAQKGDFALANELHDLSLAPYDEQPELEAKYYRMPPTSSLNRPGTAFMT